jgi:hypothetical protein
MPLPESFENLSKVAVPENLKTALTIATGGVLAVGIVTSIAYVSRELVKDTWSLFTANRRAARVTQLNEALAHEIIDSNDARTKEITDWLKMVGEVQLLRQSPENPEPSGSF